MMTSIYDYLSDWNLIHRTKLPYIGAAVLTLAGSALAGPWETTRIIGLVTLTGVTPHTVGRYIGLKKEGTYFPHTPSTVPLPKQLLRKVYDSWPMSAVAGVALAALARISFAKLPFKVTAKQLAPHCGILLTFTLIVSHLFAYLAEKDSLKNVDPAPGNKLRAYNMTFEFSSFVMWAGGTVLLSIAIVAARAGLINLSSPFKFLTNRSL